MSLHEKSFDTDVPTPIAGIESVTCQCGWEAVFIKPEEDISQVMSMLNHLIKCHELTIPVFTYNCH